MDQQKYSCWVIQQWFFRILEVLLLGHPAKLASLWRSDELLFGLGYLFVPIRINRSGSLAIDVKIGR
jgi:hypothetical protein